MVITGYLLKDGSDISTLFTNSSSLTPSGCVVSYLGITDVDGWVLCDGRVRTNNGDGKYNQLSILGIGVGGNATTNYTPPNLQNTFLRGGSSNSDIRSISGSDSNRLTLENMPVHNHSGTTEITDTSHTHVVKSPGDPYYKVQDAEYGKHLLLSLLIIKSIIY